MITLCLDFGNTRLKAAVFNHNQLREEILLPDGSGDTIASLLDKWKPARSILSSVIHHDEAVEQVLSTGTKFHKLSHPSGRPAFASSAAVGR